MTDDTKLERRYRRLLLTYPKAFRRSHGPEMVAVLLALSRPGQRWPGFIETANLIGHGLRARVSARPTRIVATRPHSPSQYAPLEEPSSYGEALGTVAWHGFAPVVRGWSYPSPPKWLRALVCVVVAVAAALLAVRIYRYATEEHAFAATSSTGRGATVTIGHSIWLSPGLRLADDTYASASLRSATAVFGLNTAAATVTVEQCTQPADPALTPQGFSYDGKDFCAVMTPFTTRGVTRVGQLADAPLVLKVTPRRLGMIEVRGVIVRVRQQLRRGTQRVGTDWQLTVPR